MQSFSDTIYPTGLPLLLLLLVFTDDYKPAVALGKHPTLNPTLLTLPTLPLFLAFAAVAIRRNSLYSTIIVHGGGVAGLSTVDHYFLHGPLRQLSLACMNTICYTTSTTLTAAIRISAPRVVVFC